jgi:hypothetical protein
LGSRTVDIRLDHVDFLLILLDNFVFFFDRNSIVKGQTLEILYANLFGSDFLFTFSFFSFFRGLFDNFCCDWYLYFFLLDLILILHLIEEIINGLLFGLHLFGLASSQQLEIDFLCQCSFVLLNNRRFVVDVTIIGSDDSSLAKIFQRSGVASFLHVEQLFLIPGVEVDRLNEGVNHTVLTMLPCAIQTKMNAKVYRGPFRVLLFAIQTNLCRFNCTLFSLMPRNYANSLSLVTSSTC